MVSTCNERLEKKENNVTSENLTLFSFFYQFDCKKKIERHLLFFFFQTKNTSKENTAKKKGTGVLFFFFFFPEVKISSPKHATEIKFSV